jgi:hypothetical protein
VILTLCNMCVAKYFTVSPKFRYFIVVQNISFCLFCKKNRDAKQMKFREMAVCFAFSRNRNKPFHQEPLSGTVKSTAPSQFSYCFKKCSKFSCFVKYFVKLFAKYFMKRCHKMIVKQAKNSAKYPLVCLF